MHIDKSFQLLSADSGKVATDEARRQSAGDEDAEFSDLLGTELEQQEQRKVAELAAGADKKAGQEVAALFTQQTKAAEQSQAEKLLAGMATASDDKAKTAETAAELSAIVTNAADAQATAVTATDTDTDQPTSTNPWLAIISQSHDLTAILAQPAQSVAMNDAQLTTAETLVAELLGIPVTEQPSAATSETPTVDLTASNASQVDESAFTGQKSAAGLDLTAKNVTEDSDNQKTLPDAALLKMGEDQPAAKQQGEAVHSGASANRADRFVRNKPNTLPAEQVTVQELFKTDKPHSQTARADSGEAGVAAGPDSLNPPTASNGAITSGAVSAQTTQLQITAESVAGQLNAADGKATKASATAPVEFELPIEVAPDEKTISVLPQGAATTAVVSPAKNAPQSFAQFQKAANAAAALIQKQQLQTDQTQNQPLQELAAQQTTRFAEMNTASAQHTDSPVAFNSLLQTERSISSSSGGGSAGSSTGQQQQQTTSQVFAAKLNDTVSNQQPVLNLLEPNAATQLKERVMFQVNQKIHSAEIKLAPEELGSMQIKVQLQQEQLSVQFVVQQAGAKEALEQQMPRLREMLEEQGIQLTEGQVSQQREGSAEQRQARETNHALGKGSDMDDEPLQQQAIVRVSERMVDYYA